jgi:hypothetical protein
MKSSSFNSRDNNYCHHYVIQRIAGFAITLYYYFIIIIRQDRLSTSIYYY